MAYMGLRSVIGASVAVGLLLSSAAAGASVPSIPQEIDPWAVLAAMSGGAPAATICSSAAVTAGAQRSGCVLPVLDPPPPAPAPPQLAAGTARVGIDPLLFGLMAIAADLELYLIVHGSGRHANSPA